MIYQVYTIYDSAAAYYKNPWCCHTDAQAMREFTDIFAKENPIADHPEHYHLIRVGTWDNSHAVMKQQDQKTLLTGLEALALRNKDQNEINDSIDNLGQ